MKFTSLMRNCKVTRFKQKQTKKKPLVSAIGMQSYSFTSICIANFVPPTIEEIVIPYMTAK